MSSNGLWRRTVEVLRRQFEEGSFRHAGLHVFTAEATSGDDVAAKHLEKPPPGLSRDIEHYLPETSLGRASRIRELSAAERESIDPNDPRLVRDPRDPSRPPIAIMEKGTTRVTCFFGGKPGAREEFKALARAMGRVLPSMPREYTQIIPPEVIWHSAAQPRKVGPLLIVGGMPDPFSEGSEHRRWVQSLFEIAWLNLPASPLRATRQSWEGTTTFPYDPKELQILKQSGFMSDLFKSVPNTPAHFFSELPMNAFLASVLAIDALLDMDAAEQLEPGSLLAWAGSKAAHLAVVFTDLKAGTGQRIDLGEDAMNDLVDAHFARARTHIRQNAGRQVKTTGDGVIAVFKNAGDALNFALALSVDKGDERLQMRAAIHVDQVFIEDNDIAGLTPAYAARMLGVSKEADIRVSEAARKAIVDRKSVDHERLTWIERPVALKDFGAATMWIVGSP